jgi:hypothetical protein
MIPTVSAGDGARCHALTEKYLQFLPEIVTADAAVPMK